MHGILTAVILLLPIICCAENKQDTSQKNLKNNTAPANLKAGDTSSAVKTAKIPPYPKLEVDSQKNIRVFNYFTEITPIQPKIGALRDYVGKNLMVVYFSVHCGHCRKAIPHIMKLAESLYHLDISTIAIATASSKPEQISPFIEKHKVYVPMFNDQKRNFSRKYGTGYVPLIVLLNKKGHFIRIRSFNHQSTPDLILDVVQDSSLFPE